MLFDLVCMLVSVCALLGMLFVRCLFVVVVALIFVCVGAYLCVQDCVIVCALVCAYVFVWVRSVAVLCVSVCSIFVCAGGGLSVFVWVCVWSCVCVCGKCLRA